MKKKSFVAKIFYERLYQQYLSEKFSVGKKFFPALFFIIKRHVHKLLPGKFAIQIYVQLVGFFLAFFAFITSCYNKLSSLLFCIFSLPSADILSGNCRFWLLTVVFHLSPALRQRREGGGRSRLGMFLCLKIHIKKRQ